VAGRRRGADAPLRLRHQWIGVHGLFGAFLAGVVMPREPALRTLFTSRLEGVTVAVLLPLFFALTGLRTDVTLLASGVAWATFVVILVAAVAGKLGGSALAARAMGMAPRNALLLGLLLNARGLVELVVLGAGLDLGVLSPALYSMMVLMAVVTTFMTTPLVSWLHPGTEDTAVRPRG
jgi:Kef-type K+ transport system membrane component KefB